MRLNKKGREIGETGSEGVRKLRASSDFPLNQTLFFVDWEAGRQVLLCSSAGLASVFFPSTTRVFQICMRTQEKREHLRMQNIH